MFIPIPPTFPAKSKTIDNLNIKKINNITESGFILEHNEFKNSNYNKNFVKEIWKADIDEITELIEIEQDKYVLIKVDKEIKKQNLNFRSARPIVLKNYILSRIRKETLSLVNNYSNRRNNYSVMIAIIELDLKLQIIKIPR